MINEPSLAPREFGWIEVVCGGMFSGKTEELIRRAKRAHIAGQKVVVVKPALDKRYSENEVVSHNETALPSILVDTADQIVLLTGDARVVCIDEAQFFDDRVVDVANTLANDGKRVIVAGLDMDFKGQPFGPMPYLLAIAEYVTKLHAVCAESGTMAHYSQRVVEKEGQVLVGEYDAYEPRARHCFRPPVDRRRGRPIKPFMNPALKETEEEPTDETEEINSEHT
ncbi:thymidine kinase [Gracilimonas sediminicola]|uniref:Thymidine kinase n=1 Tax=Gracilimonas sediminicola TaxID=2952158 RepID=A0A9X2L5K3_9BACT|nr:thymidine kinase [Gracilimonas sediminicola]MCP9292756.1 thymidine kinase [Gracilimonas sediminicola]